MNSTRDRGFALLIVLWSLVLISLLMAEVIASGRTALALAGNLRAAAEAGALADGAVNEALFHVLATGRAHWQPDGALHQEREGDMVISLRVRSLAGMVNPNIASPALLAGLLQAVGMAQDQAQQVGNAIVVWRSRSWSPQAAQALAATYRGAGLPYAPPGHPFGDLGQLAYVIGMSPDILAKALPYMSLDQPGDPDPTLAAPVVRQALHLSAGANGNGGSNEGAPAVSIEAEITATNGVSVCREAVVSVPGASAQTPFRFLSLTTVSDCR